MDSTEERTFKNGRSNQYNWSKCVARRILIELESSFQSNKEKFKIESYYTNMRCRRNASSASVC